MKIYRVSYHDKYGEHKGFSYHGSKIDAMKSIKDIEDTGEIEGDYNVLDFPRSKKQLISSLNRYCSHPDNG